MDIRIMFFFLFQGLPSVDISTEFFHLWETEYKMFSHHVIVLMILISIFVATARDSGGRSQPRHQRRLRQGRRNPTQATMTESEAESTEVTEATETDEEPDQCVTIGVTLSKRQYEDLCPVREIANLRKQIHDVKHILRNNTAMQV